MNTQRNPENLNSEAPNSAVQISAEMHNPNPWVIVEGVGTDDESFYCDYPTYRAAIQSAIRELGPEFAEEGYDIMKRNDDGTLTTEF